MNFYKKLIVQKAHSLKGIDSKMLRRGKWIRNDKGHDLVKLVTNDEIMEALKSIGDSKAPGVDGYNSKFFTSTWRVIGEDVKKVIQYFFRDKNIYLANNCTLVTMIPKKENAKKIKNMRPICCCTTL